MDKKIALEIAEEKFREKHPEWGCGELRDIDEDIKHTLHFSDLENQNREGNVYPFIPSNDGYFIPESLSGFWIKIYKKLSGLEAIVIFCLYQWGMTQEQTADYLGISQQYVSRIFNQAKEKLSNI